MSKIHFILIKKFDVFYPRFFRSRSQMATWSEDRKALKGFKSYDQVTKVAKT